MKKILVPVDFSKHSEYALEAASKIAKQHRAEIVLLHMIGMSDSVLANSDVSEEAEAKYFLKLAKDKINEFTKKKYLNGIPVDGVIQNYKDFEEVNQVALEQNCDLIVMGSHGTSGLKELFVGSNTEKVVRSSELPVIVIKASSNEFDIKRMVMACDLEMEAIPVYRKAEAFAQLNNASLEVVYVHSAGANFMGRDDVVKRMENFKKELGEQIDIHFYDDNSVERGILRYCFERNADLLVIPTHGRKGLDHFVVGSLAENVSNHAKIPVMTIKI
ncbi:MAG TPA: universal stress protein [Muricauda sp.]|uniref:Universal stress protein n=1 Tax=Flagellimonas aurea TaxID=2915619 RepID=A0ABS3G1Y3_9FLAO|nr:universal stress protein [Allomuricauda aurea]MBO0353422.1 universal stress protein [Allomuricauda aurea]HBU77532.1 universal stress protein [Allomuricauda sp.]|tara:strand:- start:400 stop:1221 length:822 start_codon:yes stop_codon:yes gene_type:complete